jgi:hypothetical protein
MCTTMHIANDPSEMAYVKAYTVVNVAKITANTFLQQIIQEIVTH